MTTFEKLQARILKDLGIEITPPKRTYVGYWQRANGNWVWQSSYKDSPEKDIGSCFTATELLRSKTPLQLYSHGYPHLDEIIL